MDINTLIQDPMKVKVKQNETIVVSYDSFQFIEPYIVHSLTEDNTSSIFFNINKFKNMSYEQMIPYILKRKYKNVLESIIRDNINVDIDCNKLLRGMISNSKDIFKVSPINTVFKDLRYLLLEKTVTKVVFVIEDDENYTRKKQRIIHQYGMYNKKLVSKIKIVKTKPNDKDYFIKLCKRINFTNLFIDDIEIANTIYTTFTNLKNKNILLPSTGYNVTVRDDEIYLKHSLDFDPDDKKCIVTHYQPLEFTQEQLNQG